MMFLLIGVLATSVMIGGCSNSVGAQEETARLEQENQDVTDHDKQLQEQNQEREEEAEAEELESEPGEEDAPKSVSSFNIYGADSNTYDKALLSQVSIEDKLMLEEKLEILAKQLSKEQFEGLGIELYKIDDEEGKKIATMNLIESADDSDPSWIRMYFQGSTGGIVTTVSLDETFLQKEYDGDWIDGVRFLYEGEKIMFDHVESLGEISYR